ALEIGEQLQPWREKRERRFYVMHRWNRSRPVHRPDDAPRNTALNSLDRKSATKVTAPTKQLPPERTRGERAAARLPPLGSSRVRWLIGGLVSAGGLIVNCLTMAPTVTLVDSGELIVASAALGVAHPPGFPLYCILAHLASFLPLGSVARRVNFASALFAA